MKFIFSSRLPTFIFRIALLCTYISYFNSPAFSFIFPDTTPLHNQVQNIVKNIQVITAEAASQVSHSPSDSIFDKSNLVIGVTSSIQGDIDVDDLINLDDPSTDLISFEPREVVRPKSAMLDKVKGSLHQNIIRPKSAIPHQENFYPDLLIPKHKIIRPKDVNPYQESNYCPTIIDEPENVLVPAPSQFIPIEPVQCFTEPHTSDTCCPSSHTVSAEYLAHAAHSHEVPSDSSIPDLGGMSRCLSRNSNVSCVSSEQLQLVKQQLDAYDQVIEDTSQKVREVMALELSSMQHLVENDRNAEDIKNLVAEKYRQLETVGERRFSQYTESAGDITTARKRENMVEKNLKNKIINETQSICHANNLESCLNKIRPSYQQDHNHNANMESGSNSGTKSYQTKTDSREWDTNTVYKNSDITDSKQNSNYKTNNRCGMFSAIDESLNENLLISSSDDSSVRRAKLPLVVKKSQSKKLVKANFATIVTSMQADETEKQKRIEDFVYSSQQQAAGPDHVPINQPQQVQHDAVLLDVHNVMSKLPDTNELIEKASLKLKKKISNENEDCEDYSNEIRNNHNVFDLHTNDKSRNKVNVHKWIEPAVGEPVALESKKTDCNFSQSKTEDRKQELSVKKKKTGRGRQLKNSTLYETPGTSLKTLAQKRNIFECLEQSSYSADVSSEASNETCSCFKILL